MTLQEILEGIKAGTIAVDFYGHSPYEALERIISDYERNVDNANGAGDGGWGKHDEEPAEDWDKRMRKHFQQKLDSEYEPGEDMFDMPQMDCYHCGLMLYWVFDGDRISLRRHWNEKDWVSTEDRCEFETLKPMVTSIKTDGNLVFTNFFRCEDSEEGKKYTSKYNLNSIGGRQNIAAYKAKNHNIAYGQMGNMSVGVFVNEAGDSIIIGNPYVADEFIDGLSEEEYEKVSSEKDYEELSVIDGHKMVGSISLAVWRWEAGDKEKLGPLYDEVKEREYTDIVEVKCAPGEWEVIHYFDIAGRDEPIYSTLKKKA